MVILDLETDGLWPQVSRVWCAVAYDMETRSFLKFYENASIPLSEASEDWPLSYLTIYLDKVATQLALCCHNGIGFDLKVLKKILNYEYTGEYVDTYLLSRILFPDIEAPESDHGGRSRHSVEAWGARFGHPKVKHEDWSQFSQDMLHRCQEDVKIQAQIYEYCMKKIEEYS